MAETGATNIVSIPSEDKLGNENIQIGYDMTNKIIDDTIHLLQGHCEESESQTHSVFASRSSKESVDRRLQYWKNMLRQRRAVQKRLCLEIGKQPEDILFNIDYQKDQVVKRFLDCCKRNDMIITSLKTDIQEDETAKVSGIELVGLSRQTTLELLGNVSPRVSSNQKLSGNFEAIKNILGFYPEFNGLEVIGRSIHSMNSLAKPVQSIDIAQSSEALYPHNTKSRGTMTAILSVVINGTPYCRYKPEFSPILEKLFVCHPYEHSFRTIMRIENNGQLPLTFKWQRSEFFAYNNTLFNSDEDVFIFDTEPFRLRTYEVREVSVLFRPSRVGIVKQRWLLTTNPKIFYRCPCALTLNMHGSCKPPQEYLELIESMLKMPLRHSRQLSQIPLCQDKNPIEFPYVRELDDREAFNQRNVGFRCERDSDIEALKNFFQYVKPETSRLQWDFNVSMLIALVCCKKEEVQRIALFTELKLLLDNLRGRSTPLRLSDGQAKLAERNQTRFIFVRGIIDNYIDVWEDQIWSLASQMLLSKPYRDSMYIYTYDQLCNLAEDIVSVIESTEQV